MKHLFRLIDLIALAACVYFGVQAYRSWADAPDTVAVAPETTVREKAEAPAPASADPGLTAAVVQRDLFQTREKPEEAKPELRIEELQQTQLNLKLWGTVTLGEGAPYAVIEEKGSRRQNLYRVGDMIQNALIKHILRARVVLNVDGRDEILEMQELVSGQGGPPPSAGPVRPPSPAAPPQPAPGVGEQSPEPVTQQIAVSAQVLQEALEDPEKVMQSVRLRPHFSNGQIDGISLTGLRPDSVLRKLGLRNGDVVNLVNGEDVRSVEDAVGLFNQLEAGDEPQIQIQRRGRDQILEYRMQ